MTDDQLDDIRAALTGNLKANRVKHGPIVVKMRDADVPTLEVEVNHMPRAIAATLGVPAREDQSPAPRWAAGRFYGVWLVLTQEVDD